MIFDRISIGKKITGSMVILLSIMFTITLLSFLKAQRTDDELKVLAKHVIPLSNLIARIDINSLEQEVILERILRRYETEQPDTNLIKKELAKFEILSQKIDEEIDTGEQLLESSLKEIDIIEDAIELAKLVPLLSIVEKEHQDIHDDVLAIIEMRKNNVAQLHGELEGFENESDELDQILLQAVTIIAKLSEKESEEVMVGELMIHDLTLIVSALIFFVGFITSPLISKGIVAPLKRMMVGAEAISNGDLDIEIPVTSKDEVGELSSSFNKMAKELRQKERIKETFGKYVDPRIIERLLAIDDNLEIDDSQKKEMTIFPTSGLK